MRRNSIILMAALPLLGACALGPKPPVVDTRLPAAFEAPATAATPDVALDRWWSQYDDPQLQALVDEALARAPDALSALARLEEARAVRASALDA